MSKENDKLKSGAGARNSPQVIEEKERLCVYEIWPSLPPRIQKAILLITDAFDDEEAEQ